MVAGIRHAVCHQRRLECFRLRPKHWSTLRRSGVTPSPRPERIILDGLALTLGTTLGPYEIQSPLGAGGMGEVYKARDTRLDRTVAIKVLPQQVAADPALKQRFEREARTIAALNHPHICTIHDIGQQDGIDFLVMEYLEGETLASRLTKGALPLGQALKYACEIADAVDKAHRHGIVHRDLKPGNIMLTPSGAKLLDFGLAKLKRPFAVDSLSMLPTQQSPITAEGTIPGTLPYMAPEQLEGKEADARTDLFAFGAVLYEMVTGRRAFESKSQASLIAAIIDRDPPLISSLAPMSPPGLDWIVGRCLAKDPDDRWQTARDLLAELRRTADGDFPLASSLPVVPGRRRGAVVGALVAASVLTLIVAGVVGWNLRPSASGQVARFAFIPPAGQTGSSFLVLPVARSLSSVGVSRDGTRIAFEADGRIYFRNINETDVRPFPVTPESLPGTQPVFSPDGRWLLYALGPAPATGSFNLVKAPVTGGTPVTLLDGPRNRLLRDLTWETDDTILYAEPSGIMRISASGGMPEILVKPVDGETLGDPRLLPGGRWVLFSSTTRTGINTLTGMPWWDDGQIMAQSIDSGERRLIWKGGSDARYVPTGHIVYARGNTLFALPFRVGDLMVTGGPVAIVEGVRRSVRGVSGTANYFVSDTGTLAYVLATQEPAALGGVLALVDRNGVVEKLNVPSAQYRGPHLSPDGRQLAVEILAGDGQSDIWVYDLSRRTALRQVTRGGNNGHPIWTQDSKRITFVSTRDGRSGIYWQAADGSGVAERLTTAEQEGEDHVPESWSPNGRTLSFSKFGTATQSGWTLSVEDGAKPVLLVGGKDGKEVGSGAVFSPDGRWLAYRENRAAGEQIYIQPFPPTGEIHRVTQHGGSLPLWSPDGRELFYRRGIAGTTVEGPRLMRVGITTEGALRWTDEQVLPMKAFQVFLGYRDYDITPDGRRFLMIVPASPAGSGETPPQIHVVLNWHEELKRRIAPN